MHCLLKSNKTLQCTSKNPNFDAFNFPYTYNLFDFKGQQTENIHTTHI